MTSEVGLSQEELPNLRKSFCESPTSPTSLRKSDFAESNDKELTQRYAEEAESIKKSLFLTEEQMQELKIKAREEFEKQIADGIRSEVGLGRGIP